MMVQDLGVCYDEDANGVACRWLLHEKASIHIKGLRGEDKLVTSLKLGH